MNTLGNTFGKASVIANDHSCFVVTLWLQKGANTVSCHVLFLSAVLNALLLSISYQIVLLGGRLDFVVSCSSKNNSGKIVVNIVNI